MRVYIYIYIYAHTQYIYVYKYISTQTIYIYRDKLAIYTLIIYIHIKYVIHIDVAFCFGMAQVLMNRAPNETYIYIYIYNN